MAIDIQNLGKLSARYESNGSPGCVSSGRGDHGGVSYGMYQFSADTGSAREFVKWLALKSKAHHKRLQHASPGSPLFAFAWQRACEEDKDGFAKAQHDFVAEKYYVTAKGKIEGALPGLDFDDRSTALNETLWSTAVQHGVSGSATVFKRALAGQNASSMCDADIIKAVYAERSRVNSNGELVYFRRSSAAVQQSVSDRFKQELQDALRLLQIERT